MYLYSFIGNNYVKFEYNYSLASAEREVFIIIDICDDAVIR